MKIGFKTSQTNVDWGMLKETWQAADELPVFDSGWVFDHFVALGAGGSCLEGWTVLTALAATTRRLQLGHLVLGNTYRHPAVLARMAATLDIVADGRFVLGLGAGWHEAEHAMYGLPLPPIGERIGNLESAVRVLRAIWSSPTGVTLDAPPYHLADATCDPPPLTPGGPRIWLGGQKPRGIGIAARLADGWNHSGGDPAEFTAQRDILLRACEAAGRDPGEVEVSVQIRAWDTPDSEVLASAIRYAEAGAQHVILMTPGADGPDGLARLATEVAEPLRARFG
jgi:alkanesulfonate monooxygenase SsuD/methylene tetrahydromethanopterin reductase-like flavin-dependent oxidoreductase (luciferase family)